MVHAPGKLLNSLSPRDFLPLIVQDRSLHMIALNRYRFSEQHSCLELTHLIETLNGQPAELVQDLSHHVAEEARHAALFTDLLQELGEEISLPPCVSYINEFERLLDQGPEDFPRHSGDRVIATLVAMNITEKRVCQIFSAHVAALKAAPATAENQNILDTLLKIFPEEASHVGWSNRWLAKLVKQDPAKREKVKTFQQKYALMEQAAYDAGMDILAGAEFRRLGNLIKITKTLPPWQRPVYFLKRLPQTLIAPDLQRARIFIAQRALFKNPQRFVQQLLPMFLSGVPQLPQAIADETLL